MKTLKLALSDQGITGLGRLQSCTSIEALRLTDLRPPHDLPSTQNDVFTDVVAWLKQCSNLREINLTDFVSAPDILTPVLNQDTLLLEELQINAKDNMMYMMKDHPEFHQALGKQYRLQSLLLKADPESSSDEELELFCTSLCSLRDLRYLELKGISENFQDTHVSLLAECLLKLEELTVVGSYLEDSSLEKLSNLGNLRSVTFMGPSMFTANGLLDFIDKLGPGNQGLTIGIYMALPERLLGSEEQDLIREALMQKVQGRFDYVPIRGESYAQKNTDFDESFLTNSSRSRHA